MEPATLGQSHPDIYANGPTDAMYEAWDAEWAARRMPWSGEFPGCAECREFGWYAKLVPGKGWVRCRPDEPGATEDLNRLHLEAVWDQERQRFVIRHAPTTPPPSRSP